MPPTNIAEHVLQRWPFGELLCELVLATDRCNIFSSVYFPAAVSTDLPGGAGRGAAPPHAPAHCPRG